MFNQFRKRIATLIAPAKNAMSAANDFLKYGNRGMRGTWDEVIMSEQDSYTGYGFAAIHKRAIYTALVATEHVKLHEDKQEGLEEHPYEKLIYDSMNFSEFDFWYSLSTYLDLFGVGYILVVRANKPGRARGEFSNPKEFQILNPKDVRRVLNPQTLKVEGYVEVRGGLSREIKPDNIIEIRQMNPFDSTKDFSMSKSARDSQFTIKSAGDYTRHVIQGNIKAPGVISTDVIMEEEDFANFKARLKAHTAGEPLFGNGKGAIAWTPMTTDLSKASLKDTNEMSREQLFVVYGISKTIAGIEQSGTTRETANVQKDLFIGSEITTQIKRIIDPLNRDYRIHYPQDYAENFAFLIIENPQGTDHDAELKATDVKQKGFDLYTSLLDKGYTPDKASAYVKGEITVSELGQPTNPPKEIEEGEIIKDNPTEAENSLKKKDYFDYALNSMSEDQKTLIERQQQFLKNSIINVDEQLVAAVIRTIEKKTNSYEIISDIIKQSDLNAITNELDTVLQTFYGNTIKNEAFEVMKRRAAEFDMIGSFSFDKPVKTYVKMLAGKVSESHVDTVMSDLLVTTREAALEGLGQKEIISKISTKYVDTIVKTRATTIARTETNRAFTRAQYEADRQFITQNELEKKAFKKWKTRSDNPCPFCLSLEAEGEKPFEIPFRDLGDEVVVGEGDERKELPVNFESLEAGNAHPNCSCIYELIIKG
jgi:hypothetical protein